MHDAAFTESVVEHAALAWLESTGWLIVNGPEIAPDTPVAERGDYGEIVLAQRLHDALARLNPALPTDTLEHAFRKLTRPEGADLVARNRALHRLLVDGVTVEYRDSDGSIRGAQARAIDFDVPEKNDWLAVNQFSVVEDKHSRRPDIVLFVNGLPLAVIELKNAADENATIWSAFKQLQTYKAEIPSLFATNALLVVSDGVEARAGTLTAGREWFKPWRTVSGEQLADPHLPELQVMIEGLCAPRRFLDLVRDFIVFEDEGGGRIAKKMAGYHQLHAVQVAVAETLRAAELRHAAFRPRVIRTEPEERYSSCVPLVPLQAAAGTFGNPQHIEENDLEWVTIDTPHRLRPGMFVAEVVGRSMEPSIPDGSWCLFSAPVEGTRQGKTVLVQLRDEVDPETGQRYTVKRYESEKARAGDSWRHTKITLKPTNPAYAPIVIEDVEEDAVQVIAELVEVLGTEGPVQS